MWILFGTLAWLLAMAGCIVSYAIHYLSESVQVASFSQLLYTMTVSMGGADNTIMQILEGFLLEYALWIILLTIAYACFLYIVHIHTRNGLNFKNLFKVQVPIAMKATAALGCVLAASVLFSNLRTGYEVLGIQAYLDSRNRYSSLYENKYVNTADARINFGEDKKNLIYIVCESMESSYADLIDEKDPSSYINAIPNLTKLAMENEDFSGSSDAINGARVTSDASWTVAGLVAQSSGTPLSVEHDIFKENFEEEGAFLPGLTTLGDILEKEGYNNFFLCGSESEYAGRRNYFHQHGNYEIFDLQSARDNGDIPQYYKEWWGFEDEKLFTYAKRELTNLAAKGEPFNFTMLTADTHFADGYECEDCPNTFDHQMENVIACSDKRIAEFVEWIKTQPFYEDSVIVIAGDHLNMDGLIPDVVDEAYERKTYFTILNGPELNNELCREYTTLDIFPTILEAMNASIEGGRLGLGTSLYSGQPTLCEELGFEKLNENIDLRSRYYEQNILQDSMFDGLK